MFKYMKGQLPSIFDGMFILNKNVHSYNTRQSNLLHIPFGKLQICRRTIRYSGVQIWNDLCSNSCISVTCSLFTFKYEREYNTMWYSLLIATDTIIFLF